METVRILRELWRHRIVVVVLAFLAAWGGFTVAYKIVAYSPSTPAKLESRKYEIGVATARILVDTPNSQVVEVSPKGAETLNVRASLLASLMVEGAVKAAIARRAGLRPDRFVAIAESANEPPSPEAKATASDPQASVLTTSVPVTQGDQLPIIEIEAQAPDASRAARLADAAVSGLRDYLDSQAALEKVPDARRLRVTGLGAAQAQTSVRGPRLLKTVVAAILLFGAGCALILAIAALVRGWRQAEASERPGPLDIDGESHRANEPTHGQSNGELEHGGVGSSGQNA
jgi:hypothetical protein